MLSRRGFRALIGAIVASTALVVVSGPGVAHADPVYVPWQTLLPGLLDQYEPNSDNNCVAGRPHCIDAVVNEMQRRFNPFGQNCSHQAAFALAYLRTTQTYRWAQAQPDYFQ